MTREEAVNRFKGIRESFSISIAQSKFYPSKVMLNELCDMAIEALSANYTTEKPKDVVEQKNDVVAEPTDLISRADAIKAIESRQTEQWIDTDVDYNNGLESAVSEIKALPSADRPSGEWKHNNKSGTFKIFTCSKCGLNIETDGWDYCPNCGAKMGGNK